MRKPPKCRYCQREVVWAVVGVKAHDDGTLGPNRRAFDLEPVPTQTCRVMAVVMSRDRGLLDVHTVGNPPPECYPVHRCPQYLQALVDEDLQNASTKVAVENFMDTFVDNGPMTPGPAPAAAPRRVRRVS